VQAEKQTFHEYIEKYRRKYRSQTPVYNPALKSVVHFTSEGFNHLLYKHGHRRKVKEIHYRLSLIEFVRATISSCHVVGKITINEETFNGSKTEVTYFELVAVLERKPPVTIKVVVKRRGSLGKLIFQSVMRKKNAPKGRF
jgi:hypothetical protein